MNKEEFLPIEVARFLLEYDADAGVLRWRVPVGGRTRAGSIAGCRTSHSKGYPVVSLFGRTYVAHRLAWFIYYGKWPMRQLDHVDNDPANFKIANLREVDDSQNRMNTSRYRNNTSGYKGVYFNKRDRKWAASICARGKSTFLGYFDTPEAASEAYRAAAPLIHGDYARTS